MASRMMALALRNAAKTPTAMVSVRQSSSAQADIQAKIGNREVVGYGWNGEPVYQDRVDYPMPAIRFKENTPDVMALREKEKGCWKKLSMAEKKAIYRASFCQTFAEMKYPTGEWKMHIGAGLIAASLAIYVALLMNWFVYNEDPITFDEEHQKAQLKRMLDLEINPIHGISSKWDYENKKWK
ncbi:unnamed protein product [Diamesa hyperborea]